MKIQNTKKSCYNTHPKMSTSHVPPKKCIRPLNKPQPPSKASSSYPYWWFRARESLLAPKGLWKGGWFCPRTVTTLSTFSKASKNGIRSRSSVSFGSSNHDVTGTWEGERGKRSERGERVWGSRGRKRGEGEREKGEIQRGERERRYKYAGSALKTKKIGKG